MHKRLIKHWLALLLAFSACLAQAQQGGDAQLEKRVDALSAELRCLVCQNQTLADSNAELALDLKQQVREKLASGMSERDVIDFMVQRYGDFVLYRPPVRATTWLLWFGPFLLLALGIGLLVRRLRTRAPSANDMTDSERRRAAQLLAGKEDMQ
ncbi:cytochrome c-type biogenesis protein [Noviherbaspirillum aridicola]|uniref:Cytochrome c-type biogenesis protein n=1 Tax=Noviherbaspirillum aridicola TaxID=2849687 RepID=A0ABQ4Q662_9BURK|nr:cytochrome c-type biogenesis protein [Noviherbaspirillum aridicola]GIZ52711.1 cytochrome c biogenesis protein [Noviherbaspirillum aridicola]